jgi:ribosomal protein S18 acetylase RimI-like enzyme
MNEAGAEIAVRLAGPDDLDAIVEAWWQLVSEHTGRDGEYWGLIEEAEARRQSREWHEQDLSDASRVLLVAEIGGRVAGFIRGRIEDRPMVWRVNKVGRVHEVAVHRDFRGQGVGRAMLTAMEAEFRKRDLSHADIMVDGRNMAARGLYDSQGYYERELHLIKKL